MRTNVVLDDALLQEAQKAGGFKTKRETIDAALRLLVKMKRQEDILDLFGKVEFFEDYDYKAMRRAN